ncbi:MAG: Hsp33 family molecular chaperone HslO [Clostridia bacterium]|nr:Hsp33 family molecular chaperone HslO [Clostridia bacterium]
MGKVFKGLICNNEISVAVLDTTDVVNEAINIHKLSPLSAAGLGRALTATAFMATQLKDENFRLSVTISGDGIGGRIITAADGKLRIRGSIDNKQAFLPLKDNGKLDVSGLVGKGMMTVVKSLGLKEPYVGKCRVLSGEIAEDFTAYYAYSEQQPTAMALGVYIGKDGNALGAGGVVMQPLPNASEESLSYAENLASKFSDISKQIYEKGINGVLEEYFPNMSVEEYEPKYECNCSREYIDKVLITVGKKELDETIKERGIVEVSCEFCNKKYAYTRDDIDELFKEKG